MIPVKGKRLEPWIHIVVAGATAGILAEVLVMRLNPEVTQTSRSAAVGAPLWATWGAVAAFIPLFAIYTLLRRVRRDGSWPAPHLTAFVYLVAAVMCRVNSDLHAEFLSPSGHRYLDQDAVAWGAAAVLALVAGAMIDRAGSSNRARIVFAIFMLMLPIVRLVWQPTPPLASLAVAARPLGEPDRPLIVVGLEGLDSKVLLTHVEPGRHSTLSRLINAGAWGPIKPHRPHLRMSLWTTVATGTYPGRHGLKSHWGWRLPWIPDQPLRLLPWTPQGSRLILPWGVAERVIPPPSSVPPLWERLRASDVTSEVFGWPGIWTPGARVNDSPPGPRPVRLEPAIAASLGRALEDFDERGDQVWEAVQRDQQIVDASVAALASGIDDLWIHLGALAETRRELEPVKRMHTREREVLDLILELLDDQLASVLEAASPEAIVAVVSPYGLVPPGSWERLRRLLGFGGDWRTSAESNPDGLLLLAGRGVSGGGRFPEASTVDIVPTLCYLRGLPVAQYMEGGVILDAIEEEFLADHPLRVVD